MIQKSEALVPSEIERESFSVEGRSDRSDTLRRYLTNVNKLINDYAEIAAQCNVDTIRWYRTYEGRVRISTLTIAVKTDVFAYY